MEGGQSKKVGDEKGVFVDVEGVVAGAVVEVAVGTGQQAVDRMWTFVVNVLLSSLGRREGRTKAQQSRRMKEESETRANILRRKKKRKKCLARSGGWITASGRLDTVTGLKTRDVEEPDEWLSEPTTRPLVLVLVLAWSSLVWFRKMTSEVERERW